MKEFAEEKNAPFSAYLMPQPTPVRDRVGYPQRKWHK